MNWLQAANFGHLVSSTPLNGPFVGPHYICHLCRVFNSYYDMYSPHLIHVGRVEIMVKTIFLTYARVKLTSPHRQRWKRCSIKCIPKPDPCRVHVHSRHAAHVSASPSSKIGSSAFATLRPFVCTCHLCS